MSNPFSILEESQKPKKKPAQKKNNTSNDKKKNVKKNTKSSDNKQASRAPVNPNKRKQKRVLLVADGSEKAPEAKSDTTQTSTAPVDGKQSFEAPASLKNYKRDDSKGYYNRKPGSEGKRFQNRDKHDKSGKKFQRYGPKGGVGKFNWDSKLDKRSKYVKKKPQEMNDEEWEKQLKVDQQKQKSEVKGKGKYQKKKKVVSSDAPKSQEGEKKGGDKKVAKTDGSEAPKGDKKKKFNKKDGDKKKKFNKNDKYNKDNKREEEEEEEVLSSDEGKVVYEEYLKNRSAPVTLNSAPREAREGVKVQAKQLQFTRALNKNDNKGYIKLKKKKNGNAKKTEGTATTTATKSSKKKKKVLSTSDFFKGAKVSKGEGKFNNKGGKKGNFNKKGGKPKKVVPNFKDSSSFPTLS